MSLNSKWFQKYKPSKLNNRKNVRFSTKLDVCFDRSTLMAFRGLMSILEFCPSTRHTTVTRGQKIPDFTQFEKNRLVLEDYLILGDFLENALS